MKKTIYLSGPITNNPNALAQFEDAAIWATQNGWNVVNPMNLTKILDDTFKRIGAPNEPEYKDYLEFDIEHLMDSDAILMLSGWNNSPGAIAEKAVAEAINIEVLFYN